MVGSRAVVFVVACLMLGPGVAVATARPAAASTPALVLDVASGEVLYAERATDPWYPASITKLMTTYVALDMVRSGRITMDTLLTLSPEAAAQPPSKMNLKPGTQITLTNALKIIMVKSANDIAMMIGQNLGGSVDGFADMMNAEARKLGMRDSHWVNPNGLPDERQHTSARDIAIVARALLLEFPQDGYLFHIGAIRLGRKVIRNHNGMLGRYPGADGMKTGFICMGGFNIVATATQNGRRLMAVVFGYPSARLRDIRAANLLDQGFASNGWGTQRIEQLPPSSLMSPPDMRPYVCGPHKHPWADDEEAVVSNQVPLGGHPENPLAALFSPSTFAAEPTDNAPTPPVGRSSLGPRVAFTPIPVFLGASPSAGDDAAPVVSKLAARKVRTKLLRRNGHALPESAQAFTATTTPVLAGTENPDAVPTLATKERRGGRAALKANLVGKPIAEAAPVIAKAAHRRGHGHAKHEARAKPAKNPAKGAEAKGAEAKAQ